MTALRGWGHGWGLPEQHLALDALVAFVDGELTPNAYDRAAAHLAGCSDCRADAAAQRQARSAIRAADTPSISPQFLRALQSIPSEAELPGQPDELALTEEGQLVTRREAQRPGSPSARTAVPAPGSSARPDPDRPAGSGTPIGGDSADGMPDDHPQQFRNNGRRARQGASVVFSGIVLGALAFMNVPADDSRNTVTTVPHPFPRGDSLRGSDVTPASTRDVIASEPAVTSAPREPAAPVPSAPGETPASTTVSAVPPSR